MRNLATTRKYTRNSRSIYDAQDRIVTRLTGWPSLMQTIPTAYSGPGVRRKTPAVYVEMMRLPEGVWLPRVVRINGADLSKLFDGNHQRIHFQPLAITSLLYRDKGREGELTK